jgi:hypothetical protein
MHLEIGLLHVVLINFFVANISVSLTLTGILRLIYLLKSSDTSRLQILGRENIAKIIMRLISFAMSSIISVIFPIFVNHLWGAYPFLLGFFYGKDQFSNLAAVRQNLYFISFAILPTVAVVISIAVKVYSIWITRQLNHTLVTVFHIDTPKNNYVDKYSFSIVHVFVIPSIMVATVMTSFSDLHLRLLFFCPLQVWLLGVVLPVVILVTNPKMRNKFKHDLGDLLTGKWMYSSNFQTMFLNRVGVFDQ